MKMMKNVLLAAAIFAAALTVPLTQAQERGGPIAPPDAQAQAKEKAALEKLQAAKEKAAMEKAASNPATPTGSAVASQPASQPATTAATYMYAGQARDQKWFDAQHKQFADKFVRLTETFGRGKDAKTRVTFTEIGEWLLKNPKPPDMANDFVEVTDYPVLLPNAKTIVWRIIDQSNILVFTPLAISGNVKDPVKGYGVVVKLTGISTAGLKENMPYKAGKFTSCQEIDSYSEGGLQVDRIPTYRPFAPLTAAEFAELLATGQRLFVYTKAGDKITAKAVE